ARPPRRWRAPPRRAPHHRARPRGRRQRATLAVAARSREAEAPWPRADSRDRNPSAVRPIHSTGPCPTPPAAETGHAPDRCRAASSTPAPARTRAGCRRGAWRQEAARTRAAGERPGGEGATPWGGGVGGAGGGGGVVGGGE